MRIQVVLLTFFQLRSLYFSCLIDLAKMSRTMLKGRDKRASLSYPTTEFDTVITPSSKYFLYQDTAFLWFSNCITGHFFFASLSSSRTSPWLLNGEMPLSAFLGISPLPTPSPPPRWCLFSRFTSYLATTLKFYFLPRLVSWLNILTSV